MHIPQVVTIPQNTWTLVATAVVRTIIQKKNISLFYNVTYREHGKDSPVDNQTGASWVDEQLDVRSKRRIDVYIRCRSTVSNSSGEVEVFL